MSIKFQDVLNGIKNAGNTFLTGVGNVAVGAKDVFLATVKKIAEVVGPHLDKISAAAKQNKQSIILVGVSVVASAVVTATIAYFIRGTKAQAGNQQMPPNTAPVNNVITPRNLSIRTA